MRRAEREALLLGLLQGPAELVPISSSGHAEALPWLLGWEIAGWDGARRKSLGVALHLGTAAALLIAAPPRRRPRVALLAAGVLPPAVVGTLLQERIETRLGTPGTLATGLLAGGAALVLADRAPSYRTADDATVTDGLLLGLAQCAALWPGVSRSGATLAAARARGFTRPDASRLSWEVGLPILIGAACKKRAWHVSCRGAQACKKGDSPLSCTAAAFASTLVAAKTLGIERRRPLWPWAAWRAALAGAILAVRHNRAR